MVGDCGHFDAVFLAYGAPARYLCSRSKAAELGQPIGSLLDDLVLARGLPLEVHHVQSILVHLLNDEHDFADAPYVVHVADVHLRVDVEFSAVHLTLLLRLHVQLLSLHPIRPNLFVFRVVHELVNDVVDFEADAVRFVANHDSFHSIKVAYKARLLEEQVVL